MEGELLVELLNDSVILSQEWGQEPACGSILLNFSPGYKDRQLDQELTFCSSTMGREADQPQGGLPAQTQTQFTLVLTACIDPHSRLLGLTPDISSGMHSTLHSVGELDRVDGYNSTHSIYVHDLSGLTLISEKF